MIGPSGRRAMVTVAMLAGGVALTVWSVRELRVRVSLWVATHELVEGQV